MSVNLSTDYNLPIINKEWISITKNFPLNSSTTLNETIVIAQEAIKNTKNSALYIFNQIQIKVTETPLSPLILKINTVCNDIEKIFNVAGSAPFISLLSGSFRAFLGQIQAIAGIALITIGQLGLIIANFSKTDPSLIAKWDLILYYGVEMAAHGFFNFVRGTGETLFATYTFGLGNVILILPNIMNERKFTPYFSYGIITDQLIKENVNESQKYLEPLSKDPMIVMVPTDVATTSLPTEAMPDFTAVNNPDLK